MQKLLRIGVMVLGVLFLAGCNVVPTNTPTPSSTSPATTQNTAPPTPDANWNTYRNEKYGYEISYPIDAMLKAGPTKEAVGESYRETFPADTSRASGIVINVGNAFVDICDNCAGYGPGAYDKGIEESVILSGVVYKAHGFLAQDEKYSSKILFVNGFNPAFPSLALRYGYRSENKKLTVDEIKKADQVIARILATLKLFLPSRSPYSFWLDDGKVQLYAPGERPGSGLRRTGQSPRLIAYYQPLFERPYFPPEVLRVSLQQSLYSKTSGNFYVLVLDTVNLYSEREEGSFLLYRIVSGNLTPQIILQRDMKDKAGTTEVVVLQDIITANNIDRFLVVSLQDCSHTAEFACDRMHGPDPMTGKIVIVDLETLQQKHLGFAADLVFDVAKRMVSYKQLDVVDTCVSKSPDGKECYLMGKMYQARNDVVRENLFAVFDRATVRVGDIVQGLRVVSITDRAVKFQGPVTVTGTVRMNGFDNPLGGRVCMGDVSYDSAEKLPREKSDTRSLWFCFTNTQEAQKNLGLVPGGQPKGAEITLDEYTVIWVEGEASNTARFLSVARSWPTE